MIYNLGTVVRPLWGAAASRAKDPPLAARPVGNGPGQFLGSISRVLAIRLGRTLTLLLCLSQLLLVLYIIFSRRNGRVSATSWERS